MGIADPDRKGDERDYLRRGSIVHDRTFAKAENNATGDSYGQFAIDHYYGPGSRWVRQVILSREGHLVVADTFTGGKNLDGDYHAGPVWHLGTDDRVVTRGQVTDWFSAPALDQAWWQEDERRVVLRFHDDHRSRFGAHRQSTSQDIRSELLTTFAYRPIQAGQPERFLSVFVPHRSQERPEAVAASIKTALTDHGSCTATIGTTRITIHANGAWSVARPY